jgi:hypothetical protein
VRKRSLALSACSLLLIVAATAVASPQFAATFEMTYSKTKPAASAGIDTHMTWSDPGEPGGKPKRVTKIKLLFNPGTRINTAALRRCRASNAAILRQGAAACPKRSLVGSATSELTTGTGAPAETKIGLFNAKRQIIVWVSVSGRTLAVYRDDVKGSNVTVNLALPSSLALLDLRVKVKAHSKGHGKKRRIYFRTPPACPPSGQWTTGVEFTYADGSSQQLSAPTPCRR